MKLLPKYLLLFLVGTLFTVGVAVTSLWGLKGLFGTANQLFERDLAINSFANQFSMKLARLRQIEKEFFIFPDSPSRQGKYIIVWNNSYSAISEDIFPGLEELLLFNNDTQKLAMIALIRELLEENSLEWQRVTKKFSETRSFEAVNMAEYGIFKKRMSELEGITDKFIESSLADLQARRHDLQATRGRTELGVKILLALAVLWGFAAPYLIARKMVDVLAEITGVAEQLGRGRVTGELRIDRQDELGDLAAAIIRIRKSMRLLLSRLKQAA